MKKIVIVSPYRSGVGSFGGSLSSLPAVEIGAKIVKGVIERSGMKATEIQEVYLGNVLQAGNGQNPARQAAIKAGIPVEVPASTVNTVCGSGLHAVGLAFSSIISGHCDVALAGGMESMSNAPYYLKGARTGYRMGNGEVIDAMVYDGLTCPINNYHMGITAENVAKEFNISRSEQDELAVKSQQKAGKARIEGKFDSEIIPITIKMKKEEIVFANDEYIREGTTVEKLGQLKPAFKPDGSVTAGNASGINDGAAAMIVISEDKAKDLGLTPFAYIKGFSLVGLRPDIMGMGPLFAVRKLLKDQNMGIGDIDLFELNEAFAAQAAAVTRELGIPSDKINVNGGAIAIGHPIGASGARILVTLLHELKKQKKRYGIASLCIGTGMGIAMLVENTEL
ncbi:TPA: acetyl-CoA C-acyltransferase [Candidatus Delongbacteria bacterium]|nr:acetyl-CoA C-acyltransferase [Candidatus Delongbacteria bacterium]